MAPTSPAAGAADGSTADIVTRLLVRARLVASGGVVGAAVGVAVVAVFGPTGRTETAFALAALCFGGGLLGWSGSVMVGGGIENAADHLDVDGEWTEAASRRAMARVVGFGAGAMLAIAVVGQFVLSLR